MYNKNILKSKKMAAVTLCAALMAAMTLTSCGNTGTANTTANETASDAAGNTITYEATSFTGEITSIEDNTITLSISDASNAGMQSMGGGDQAPSMPSGSGDGSMGSAPEMPSGNGDGSMGSAPEMPSGSGDGSMGSAPEMPSGNGDGMNEDAGSEDVTETPEGVEDNSADSTETEAAQEDSEGITVILTLNDTSVLTDENGDAVELSDLEEGNYLKVSLDEEGNISSVVLTENAGMDMSMGGMGAGNGGNMDMAMGGSGDGTTEGGDQAPSMPSGDATTGGGDGTAPDGNMGGGDGTAPDGNMGGGNGTAPDGNMGGGNGTAPGGNMGGGMGGQSSGVDSYTAVIEFLEDASEDGQTYTSTGADENAIHIDSGASVTISNATITRDSDDSTGGDNSSFYGVGAAVLVTDGNAYVEDSTIDTDAAGGAGVFAYGDGTAYVSGTSITTQQGTSGGLHAAGGGTLYAWDCNVETNGESAAAIRSDRGGGTMVIDGGSYTSNGTGSPAIYCTADIAVNNADLTANGSEAICIEGLNSIHLFNSNLTGNMPENEQNDCDWNVIVYQSMSGDSEVGNGTFSMIGGTLTAKNGGMFYTTNTDSTFYLSGVDITYADDNDYFLKCTGNSNARGWGSTGSNGANCSFTAEDQTMEGDIVYDSISTLNFYMVGSSTLTGAVLDDESNAGNGGEGTCTLYIDTEAVWTVTEDSTLTSLYNAGIIVDTEGKTVSIIGTDGTVYVQGDSDITVTVENYSTEADFSGATQATEFADYEVENPFAES